MLDCFYEAEVQLDNKNETIHVIVVDNDMDEALKEIKEKLKYKITDEKYNILHIKKINAYEVNINRLSAGDLIRLQLMTTYGIVTSELNKTK